MEKGKAGIYTILDNKAKTIAGMLSIYRHTQPAIRMFTDALNNENGILGKYPEDFDLVCLGYLEEQGDTQPLSITPDYEIIMTGKAWSQLRDNERARLATSTPNLQAR